MNLYKRHQPPEQVAGLVMSGAALIHEANVRHAGAHVKVKVRVVAEEGQQQVLTSLAVLVFLVLLGVARLALEGREAWCVYVTP